MRACDRREMESMFSWLGELMGCDEQCFKGCVFDDAPAGGRCPICEFMDRVEEAIERKEK